MAHKLAKIFLIGIQFVGFVAFVQAVPGDRANVEDFQNRARLKELFLDRNTQIRGQHSENLNQRVDADLQNSAQGIQIGTLANLPVELRIETPNSLSSLKQLELFIDGSYWGSYRIGQTARNRESIHWHALVLSAVPLGERQLRFVAHMQYKNAPSILLAGAFLNPTIEGTQSFFISPALEKLSINLEIKFDPGQKNPSIRIQKLSRPKT